MPINPILFRTTYDELVERYGAVSYAEAPIRGVWVDHGIRYEDKSLRVFVDIEDTVANRVFFAEYRAVLQERFEQIVIYVRSYPLDIV